MGLFSNQLSNVVEWDESREGVIFWKWPNDEIKKGSKLFIRPGQDAIFMYNGKIEGVFEDDGSYDIETQIIPFLSSLKGFKFGFNSGMRAEVVFINTKELLCKWGTKNAINLPAPGLPGKYDWWGRTSSGPASHHPPPTLLHVQTPAALLS